MEKKEFDMVANVLDFIQFCKDHNVVIYKLPNCNTIRIGSRDRHFDFDSDDEDVRSFVALDTKEQYKICEGHLRELFRFENEGDDEPFFWFNTNGFWPMAFMYGFEYALKEYGLESDNSHHLVDDDWDEEEDSLTGIRARVA